MMDFSLLNAENQEFNNELNHFIDSVIIPEARKSGITWFEGIGNHRSWNKTIKRCLYIVK